MGERREESTSLLSRRVKNQKEIEEQTKTTEIRRSTNVLLSRVHQERDVVEHRVSAIDEVGKIRENELRIRIVLRCARVEVNINFFCFFFLFISLSGQRIRVRPSYLEKESASKTPLSLHRVNK